MTNATILPSTRVQPEEAQCIAVKPISGGCFKGLLGIADQYSLGVVVWQVLTSIQLPEAFNPELMKANLGGESDPSIKVLLEGCFASTPSKRTPAFELAQRLLDEYNDGCARVSNTAIFDVIQRCRSLVEARRIDHSKSPDIVYSESDIATLTEFDDSWDDSGSNLRLAPEASFLIGAGILWDLITLDLIQIPAAIISRGSSVPKGDHVPNIG